MTTRDITQLPSGDLSLECAYSVPPGVTPTTAVVICHPHPQYGGDMYNNVVQAIRQGVLGAGMGALMFNFRGVGGSGGTYDDGRGERDDVRAALAFAATLDGIERVCLAGYSFGAGMAAGVVDDSAAAVALVAAPSRMLGADSALVAYAGPALLVAGDADHVSSAEAMQAAASARAGFTQVEVVQGVDHFWRGREGDLVALVTAFFQRPALKTTVEA